MGSSCSNARALEPARAGDCNITEACRTPSIPSEQDSEQQHFQQQARENNEIWFGEKRLNFSRFLNLAKELEDPEMQLLVCTLASAVLSAGKDQFTPWCTARPGNGAALACLMSPSNVNFGSSMLRGMMDIISAMVSAATKGGAVPNDPVSEPQLMNVLQFKDIWRRLMEASAIQSFQHPVLGNVAFVQPLLMNCIVARLSTGDEDLQLLLEFLLDHGATAGVRNNLGLTPLMLCAQAFATSVGGDEDPLMASRALQLTRMLVQSGADTTASVQPFGPGWRMGAHASGHLYSLELLLQGAAGQAFTAAAVLSHLLPQGAKQPELVEEMQRLLQPRAPQQKLTAAAMSGPVPWTQAIFNIIWAAAQVTSVPGARQRSAVLQRVRAESPFTIPALLFCGAAQLRQLGHIPRYSTQPAQAPGSTPWTPTAAEDLPEGAVTIFLSHRWLGNGCPDDDRGTKLAQALQVAELVAQQHQVSPDLIYLWIDYSVVDQSDPMPGVQALAIFIACCDHFVYIHNPSYWERAWCLTEQYMYWKLCYGQPKHFYNPSNQALLLEQPNERRPPEPALGKLFCEGDRVALATLTAIMPD